MPETLAPVIATLCIIALGGVIGMALVRKMIQIREARHELRYGSASFLRGIGGWFVIALWLAAVWFLATITGDWWATGDLEGAIERSGRRLQLLIRILAALGDD